MAKVKIYFHPIFILFAFLLIYFGMYKEIAIYVLVLLMHEYCHAFVALLYGYKLSNIVFMPYGAGINCDNCINPKHDVVIAVCGPAFNLIFALVIVCLWWMFPITYGFTQVLFYVNISLGLFNLIPVYPLDGGRVLVDVLTIIKNKYFAFKVAKVITIFFAIIFFVLFVISVIIKANFSFLFISIFLFTSSLDGIKNIVCEKYKCFLKNKSKDVVEVKEFVVNKKYSAYSLLKYLNNNYYARFNVVDDNFKTVKILTETELKNKLINFNNKTNF